MKKTTIAVLTAILMGAALCLFAQSCDKQEKVLYNVRITGDADGDVALTFPDGSLNLDGTAGIDFHYGNTSDSLSVANADIPVIEDALCAKKASTRKAAKAIWNDFGKAFGIKAAKGTYWVHLYGTADIFGIEVKIDHTYSNR